MRFEFREPGQGAPDAILANVDIVFDDPSDSLCGLRITGLAIRKGSKGDWVTFPSRKGADAKYYDYIRSATKEMKPVYRFKDEIMRQFEAWLKSDGVSAPTHDPQADEDEPTPF